MLQNPILQIVVAQHYTEAVVFAFYTKCKQFQEIVYVSFFSCGWNISLPFFVLQQFSSPLWLHFILAPPYSSFLEIFFSWQNNTTRVVPNLEFPNFEPYKPEMTNQTLLEPSKKSSDFITEPWAQVHKGYIKKHI